MKNLKEIHGIFMMEKVNIIYFQILFSNNES